MMTPSEVYALLNRSTHDVITAITRAYTSGHGTVDGATIWFMGYPSAATEFNAATALYAVRW